MKTLNDKFHLETFVFEMSVQKNISKEVSGFQWKMNTIFHGIRSLSKP